MHPTHNVLMSAPGVHSLSAQRCGIRVAAPGRLHLGFVDPAGTLGRRFGSLGLVIDGFETEVELHPAEVEGATAFDAACAAEMHRALQHLDALRRESGLHGALQLHIKRVLPAHAGLGSGTQLALAVGTAFARLHGLAWSTPDIARITGRGLRSGVGIAGFDQGGLLLDGGPGPQGQPAPLLARGHLPSAWRVLLVTDPRLRGLSGADERAALARLAPLPREAAAQISHELLMRVLPGAALNDFDNFAAGLGQVQHLLGEHFAPAQAAGAYASPAVARVMQRLQAQGHRAVGQSSWGPTAFAFVPDAQAAELALADLRASGDLDPALGLHTVRARERGAAVAQVATPGART
ncbi:beta-RFAP synthase [Burkholderiales bacterium JOSHI_001]|nr:beta-RFAP synthase [Burkholderiales bacterium JOSHI_001]